MTSELSNGLEAAGATALHPDDAQAIIAEQTKGRMLDSIVEAALDDAGLAARFPGAARWSVVRDRLVADLLARPAIGAAA